MKAISARRLHWTFDWRVPSPIRPGYCVAMACAATQVTVRTTTTLSGNSPPPARLVVLPPCAAESRTR